MFSILALGGGGSKGYLEVGAIEKLEEIYGNLTTYFHDGVYGCSVGSLFATLIAFGVDGKSIVKLAKEFENWNEMLNIPRFDQLGEILCNKGLFSMNSFEEFLVKHFNNVGIDIRTKKLSDAKIPLRIIGANLTKRVSTIFQKDIPVLTAIKASCCIPFLFHPQIINSCVYVDGGYFTGILHKVIPSSEHSKTLFVSIVHTDPKLTPKKLKSITPIEYVYSLYRTSCLYERFHADNDNTVDLYYEHGSGITSFTQQEKEEMMSIGRHLMHSFLSTKRRC